MLLYKIFLLFAILAISNALGVQVHSLSSSHASNAAQTSHSGPPKHSGSGKGVSVEAMKGSQRSESRASSGYRAVPSMSRPPPEAQPLSKTGQRFEMKQLKQGKNSANDREKFLENRITKAGNGLTNALTNQNRYADKMKSANRNPNSISGRLRSIIPGTMEYKHKQAIKQSSKHTGALTDVIHDTRTYHLHRGMSEETAHKLNTQVHGALKQGYQR